MTPKELHNICHQAAMQCPQFRAYSSDQRIDGIKFGSIPKKGYVAVINFWKDDLILWEYGYYEALPDEVQQLFEDIDKVMNKAVKNYCKGLK